MNEEFTTADGFSIHSVYLLANVTYIRYINDRKRFAHPGRVNLIKRKRIDSQLLAERLASMAMLLRVRYACNFPRRNVPC